MAAAGPRLRRARRAALPPAGDGGAEGGGSLARAVEPVPARPRPRTGALATSSTRRWPRSWAARASPRRRATAPRRTPATWRCCTSSARPSRRSEWLGPLLAARSARASAMTEPDAASSDATNISMRIERDNGDDYVLNGRKWWTTGALHPNARILIVMGKTDPDAHAYQQQSMILVPLDTPGLTILRSLPVFGYHDPEGHGELLFEDVRVPAGNLIAGEGQGFLIAQARLGPGPHPPLHARDRRGRARAGAAVRPRRRRARPSASPLTERGEHPRVDRRGAHRPRDGAAAGAQDRLADGHRRQPARAHGDRGDQGRGAADGAEDRRPGDPGARRRRGQRRLPAGATCTRGLRSLRLADGPDEVHKLSVARQELRRQRERRDA